MKRIMGSWKKKFLNESIAHPPWVDPDAEPKSEEEMMSRVKDISHSALKQAEGSLGVFDGKLEDGTPIIDVLTDVRKQLNIPGGQAVLQKFDKLLLELGVDLGAAPTPGSGIDVPESEAERRFT